MSSGEMNGHDSHAVHGEMYLLLNEITDVVLFVFQPAALNVFMQAIVSPGHVMPDPIHHRVVVGFCQGAIVARHFLLDLPHVVK